MKMLVSYEGAVLFENAEGSKKELIERARHELQIFKGKAISGLNNIEWITDSEEIEFYKQNDGIDVTI